MLGVENILTSGSTSREANLDGADLRQADLRRADLYKADLREANLRGANLGGPTSAGPTSGGPTSAAPTSPGPISERSSSEHTWRTPTFRAAVSTACPPGTYNVSRSKTMWLPDHRRDDQPEVTVDNLEVAQVCFRRPIEAGHR